MAATSAEYVYVITMTNPPIRRGPVPTPKDDDEPEGKALEVIEGERADEKAETEASKKLTQEYEKETDDP